MSGARPDWAPGDSVALVPRAPGRRLAVPGDRLEPAPRGAARDPGARPPGRAVPLAGRTESRGQERRRDLRASIVCTTIATRSPTCVGNGLDRAGPAGDPAPACSPRRGAGLSDAGPLRARGGERGLLLVPPPEAIPSSERSQVVLLHPESGSPRGPGRRDASWSSPNTCERRAGRRASWRLPRSAALATALRSRGLRAGRPGRAGSGGPGDAGGPRLDRQRLRPGPPRRGLEPVQCDPVHAPARRRALEPAQCSRTGQWVLPPSNYPRPSCSERFGNIPWGYRESGVERLLASRGTPPHAGASGG